MSAGQQQQQQHQQQQQQQQQQHVQVARAHYEDVPIYGTFYPTENTQLMLQEVTRDKIYEMTDKFYEHCFVDQHIDPFIREHNAPHGQRLGAWIIEKMCADPVWSVEMDREGLRASSHSRAWHSHKRAPSKQGRRFKLDDCRVWMRLMFWSARECGLGPHDHPVFFKWFVQFIRHFIRVYETSAPPYAMESAEWSASQQNIDTYIGAGYRMNDVIGQL